MAPGAAAAALRACAADLRALLPPALAAALVAEGDAAAW
jgi:hypothetical protein